MKKVHRMNGIRYGADIWGWIDWLSGEKDHRPVTKETVVPGWILKLRTGGKHD